jgi:predicted RNase H-like HicB family nuclease
MKRPDYVVYPAIFDNKANNHHYTVTFPDIPDTVTDGKNIEEAVRNAPDAIAIALPDYETYPTPSELTKVQADNPNKLVSLIGVDLKQARRNVTVRKNVTIPLSLATAAKKRGIDFSKTLIAALEEKLDD